MTDKTRLRKVLQRAKNDKVFFAENFLRNPDNEPYVLEAHQKAFLSLKYCFVVDVQENHYYFK